jgi:protein-disulfide isomerase/uncharacterized membrane protein
LGTSAVKRIATALCLCLVGAAVSGLLLLQHHGEGRAVSAVNQVCGDGQTSGCAEVARSSWSTFAGFPVAAWGLAFYLSLCLLLALTLLVPDELRGTLSGLVAAGLAAGLLVDLLLLAVQAFAIKAFCALCILTYVLSASALVALLPAWRGVLGLAGTLARAEGRLAVAGWVLGTLAVVGAVYASEKTLDYREARRQATLLGAPPPAAAPAPSTLPSVARASELTPSAGPPATPATAVPASPPTGPQDAKYWEQHARELQETLDDPRKLEAYFAAKAQREYDAAAPVAIDLQNVPLRGPATAPVKVVEYSDFLCPFCRNLAGALSQFVPQAGGRVAVYFKNFPLDKSCNAKLPGSTHPGSCFLALGAVCAQNQGKFEAYHDRAFGTDLRNPQAADVARLAGEAGLNAAAMEGCLDDPKTKETLAAQILEGNRLGVNATPTLYVNGKKLPRINDFVAVVDKEARKKGFPPLAQP